MNTWVTKLLAIVVLSNLLSACTSEYVFNKDFPKNGPVWIKATPQAPLPEPEPIPEPEPVMSVGEQNSLAMENLGNLGFEAEETDKGVLVFLPPNIYFQGSKSSINLDAREKISQIASELNQDYLVERSVEVSGHTDSVGPEQVNLALSKLRAEAAAEELLFSKVNKARITTTWFGETKPRENERNTDGTLSKTNQSLNRRVEFTILNPQ